MIVTYTIALIKLEYSENTYTPRMRKPRVNAEVQWVELAPVTILIIL